MPLEKFIAEAMEILKTQPAATEICVEPVRGLRLAAESGHYNAEDLMQRILSRVLCSTRPFVGT
jgi:hypothetical protein